MGISDNTNSIPEQHAWIPLREIAIETDTEVVVEEEMRAFYQRIQRVTHSEYVEMQRPSRRTKRRSISSFKILMAIGGGLLSGSLLYFFSQKAREARLSNTQNEVMTWRPFMASPLSSIPPGDRSESLKTSSAMWEDEKVTTRTRAEMKRVTENQTRLKSIPPMVPATEASKQTVTLAHDTGIPTRKNTDNRRDRINGNPGTDDTIRTTAKAKKERGTTTVSSVEMTHNDLNAVRVDGSLIMGTGGVIGGAVAGGVALLTQAGVASGGDVSAVAEVRPGEGIVSPATGQTAFTLSPHEEFPSHHDVPRSNEDTQSYDSSNSAYREVAMGHVGFAHDAVTILSTNALTDCSALAVLSDWNGEYYAQRTLMHLTGSVLPEFFPNGLVSQDVFASLGEQLDKKGKLIWVAGVNSDSNTGLTIALSQRGYLGQGIRDLVHKTGQDINIVGSAGVAVYPDGRLALRKGTGRGVLSSEEKDVVLDDLVQWERHGEDGESVQWTGHDGILLQL